MFYHFFYPLKKVITGFNVFGYISFRSAAAAIFALLISFFIGPYIIKLLKKNQIGDIFLSHRVAVLPDLGIVNNLFRLSGHG